jgi:gliding motility-associated protein GldL
MAKSKAKAKFMNMAYGLGASIVIIGALFKILHFEIGPLTGGLMLTIGLVTEAIIFAISAFDSVEDEFDWSKVYPELAGGSAANKNGVAQSEEADERLSEKLDIMLKEAKIDASLMASLNESIQNFEGAAKNMGPTADAMASQKKYGEEMTNAASQMESLNNLYKVQLDSAEKQAEANREMAENASRLQTEMNSLSSNLSSLNNVYGGMLTAMKPQQK